MWLSYSNPAPIKLHVKHEIKEVFFIESARFSCLWGSCVTASWMSFSFLQWSLMQGPFILTRWQPQLWTSAKSSNISSSSAVAYLLWLSSASLGTASITKRHCGSMVLFRFSISYDTMKDARTRTTFTAAQSTVEMAFHGDEWCPVALRLLSTWPQHRGWLGSYSRGTVWAAGGNTVASRCIYMIIFSLRFSWCRVWVPVLSGMIKFIMFVL